MYSSNCIGLHKMHPADLVQSGIHLAVSCIVFVQRIHGIWFEVPLSAGLGELLTGGSFFTRATASADRRLCGPRFQGGIKPGVLVIRVFCAGCFVARITLC